MLPRLAAVQKWLLMGTAMFVMVWAVIRACLQSMTFDEAFTYQNFTRTMEQVEKFNTNNHFLNSLLIYVTTHVLGTSTFSVRLPALLGAAVYVSVCYLVCQRLTDRFSVRLALFICLSFNPFIFDFMAAARGYSLANAFLMAALAVPILFRDDRAGALGNACVWASIALGLSFASNLSFAFVDGMAFLGIAGWAMNRREGESAVRLLGCCSLPGILVAGLICGYPLAHLPMKGFKDDFWWGAHSLKEMKDSLVQASLFQVKPENLGWFYKVGTFLRRLGLVSLGVVCVVRYLAVALDGSWRHNARVRWISGIALMVAGIGLGSLGLSWLAFHFYGLPLPMGRTGIYFAPLVTLLAGMAAAAPATNAVSLWIRRGTSLVLIAVAFYFVLCLRLSYFKEYQREADIKEAYSVVDKLNRTYGVMDFQVNGIYVSALNFYREVSKEEVFPEFRLEMPETSPGRSVYVMDGIYWRDFIQREKLAVVYKGKFSELVVVVKPDGPVPATPVEP
ncbi:MAG: hypothetical protein ABI995_14335 [Acidobacteriota bacterium]